MENSFIFLLGIKVNDEKTNDEMLRRCASAAKCYHECPSSKIIACGGRSREGELSEAAIMKTVLMGMNVSEKDIITEESSRNTQENIVNALMIAKKWHQRTLVLVTSDYHMLRARMTLRRNGEKAECRCARIPFSKEKLRCIFMEVPYTVDLLLGYQDQGKKRPEWTKTVMRILRQDKF